MRNLHLSCLFPYVILTSVLPISLWETYISPAYFPMRNLHQSCLFPYEKLTSVLPISLWETYISPAYFPMRNLHQSCLFPYEKLTSVLPISLCDTYISPAYALLHFIQKIQLLGCFIQHVLQQLTSYNTCNTNIRVYMYCICECGLKL